MSIPFRLLIPPLAALALSAQAIAGTEPGALVPPGDSCAAASASRPVLDAAVQQHAQAHGSAEVTASGSGRPADSDDASGRDYRHRIETTPLGWARLDRWCVWVEPPRDPGAETRWEERWRQAVSFALASWSSELTLVRVSDPDQAQVLIQRRRPPLLDAQGRRRASHGRALLELREVQRQGSWRLEPRVVVLLSPDQRLEALQATALHELGHAFGLWGHSDDPADAMAAVPGARPVLELSSRDRATLRWLYRQPSRFGGPRPQPANQGGGTGLP